MTKIELVQINTRLAAENEALRAELSVKSAPASTADQVHAFFAKKKAEKAAQAKRARPVVPPALTAGQSARRAAMAAARARAIAEGIVVSV